MKNAIFPVVTDENILPYYVGGIGIDFDQQNIERSWGYCNPQIFIFTEGEGQISACGEVYRIQPYTACYIPKLVPHEYHRTGEKFTSWWINFSGYDAEKLFETFKIKDFFIFNIREPDTLLHIMRQIYSCLSKDKLYGNYYASAVLYEFFIEFYKCTKKFPNTKKQSNQSIEKVITFMDKEYAQKITLDNLCNISELSAGYLCRLFKQYFDMRPLEYLNKKRIQQSKLLLTSSHLSIETVAEKVGFETPSYFAKIFRLNEGMTPSEYRAMLSAKK